MQNQKGGAFKVSGYLALLLLALAVAEAGVIRHLFAHRSIHIQMSALPTSTIQAYEDDYVVHCFPDNCHVCDAFANICFTAI